MFLFQLAVPLRPENLIASDVMSRNLFLSWFEPFSNNAPIQNYIVRYMQPSFVSGNRSEQVTTELQMVNISNLLPGVDYSFTVVAVNEIGESRPSLPLVL